MTQSMSVRFVRPGSENDRECHGVPKKVSSEVSSAFEATSALLKGEIKGEQVTDNYMITHFENNAVVAMAKPRYGAWTVCY